jgi:hypothetical protein
MLDTKNDDVVSADALTEALDALSKAMRKDDEMDRDDDRQINLFNDDEILEDEGDMPEDDEIMIEEEDEDEMDKGRMYADAIKALAENSDRVIADMEKRLDAVMKALDAMMTEMKAMQGDRAEMSKSLNTLLAQPNAPRAVVSAPVAPVAQTPATPTRGDVIRKGLTMLRDDADKLTNTQRGQIRNAIAQLEAGVPVSAVSHIIDAE